MKSQTRVLLILVSMILAVFLTSDAYAQAASGPTIFDVRRSLPLEPDEPVTKDFYINAGPESGLKKGVYISVVRAIPVHDPIQNKQQATLNIPVGKLQVIDVQRGITVARLQSELSDDERPTLEFEGVMIGDHVDLGSMTIDAPKKLKKAKRAASTEEVPVKTDAVVALTNAPAAAPVGDAQPQAHSAAAAAPTAAASEVSTSSSSSNVVPVAAPQAVPNVPKTTQPPTSADQTQVTVDTPDFA